MLIAKLVFLLQCGHTDEVTDRADHHTLSCASTTYTAGVGYNKLGLISITNARQVSEDNASLLDAAPACVYNSKQTNVRA